VRSIAIVAALLLPAVALAQAAVPAPRLLPYQGRLLRADGSPETGAPWLTFRIYGARDATTPLWTEAQSVPLTNGFYAVFLGSVSVFPDALFDGHDRWLGVTVGDGAELTPRQQLASVAYAVTATNAYRAASADQAASAALAARATLADRATSADYAQRAATAATADTATRTTRADRATTADTATTAVTASNLSGGTVAARSVTATDGISTEGTMSARQLAVTDDVSVGGDLHLTGNLFGGGPRMVGLIRISHIQHYSSDTDWSCTAMGAASCTSDSDASCTAGALVPLLTTSSQAGTEPVAGSPSPVPYYLVTAQSICFAP
jgi:hypothetical protein